MDVRMILKHYLLCALWTSTDSSNDAYEPLDENYSIEDFSIDAINSATADITAFLVKAGDKVYTWQPEQIGHDLWLSRNGHGAGFFDMPLPYADDLQATARDMGECTAYVDDYGKIDFM